MNNFIKKYYQNRFGYASFFNVAFFGLTNWSLHYQTERTSKRSFLSRLDLEKANILLKQEKIALKDLLNSVVPRSYLDDITNNDVCKNTLFILFLLSSLLLFI